MDNTERDKLILRCYPVHILLMVKAAKKALEEGRARIEDGVLIVDSPTGEKLDGTHKRKVDS